MGSTDISRLPNKLSTYKHKHLQTQTKPHFRNLSSWRENADALALQAATAALAVPAPAAENKFPSPTYLFRMHLRFFFSPAASHDSTRNLISLPSLGFSDLGWRDIVLGMDRLMGLSSICDTRDDVYDGRRALTALH